jgi:hypothetical protein
VIDSLSARSARCVWLFCSLGLTACAIERRPADQAAPVVLPTGLDDAGQQLTGATSGARSRSTASSIDAGTRAANQGPAMPDAGTDTSADAADAIKDAEANDAAIDANVVKRQPRVPARHRSAGSTCLAERGPGVDSPQCANRSGGAAPGCVHDSDCTNGARGRCLTYGGPACNDACSYDTCTTDSDCPSNQPCECRASTSSAQPNACVTGGECRVDADCGAAGYCSPSLIGTVGSCFGPATCWPDAGEGSCSMYTPAAGWVNVPCSCRVNCGHGYFCHTPSDACIDDAECEGRGTCNYDTEAKHWSCSGYVGPL